MGMVHAEIRGRMHKALRQRDGKIVECVGVTLEFRRNGLRPGSIAFTALGDTGGEDHSSSNLLSEQGS